MQRHEAEQRDPNIVVFERYAFDLSQFASGAEVIKYSVRELYLWELIAPDRTIRCTSEQPGQFRAELHDRLLAPLYPLAFVVIAFAFSARRAPRGRAAAWSMLSAVIRRGVGACGWPALPARFSRVKYPSLSLVQYAAVVGTMAASLYAISRGLIIEPPALLTKAVDTISERFARRTGAVAEPAQ